MSKYTDDLKTLILEHERIIQRFEERLENWLGEEAQDQVIRTQIEFFALNTRSLKLMKEQELDHALQMEPMKAEAGPINIDAEFFLRRPSPAMPAVIQVPAPPPGLRMLQISHHRPLDEWHVAIVGSDGVVIVDHFVGPSAEQAARRYAANLMAPGTSQNAL